MMDDRSLPEDYIALADIGLPGGRSGLSLLQDLDADHRPAPMGYASQASDLRDWMGAALDIGGFEPFEIAPPSAA
jgi:hypothetical protein